MSPRSRRRAAGFVPTRSRSRPLQFAPTGFGGSTWVDWSVPISHPGGIYLFRLEGLAGKGNVI